MKSMTAYAQVKRDVTLTAGGAAASTLTMRCEIKSLNSRYSEFSVSLPAILNQYEPGIRGILNEGISRGKVYCAVRIEAGRQPLTVMLDEGLLSGVRSALAKAGIKNEDTLLAAVPFDQLFTVVPPEFDDASKEAVLALVRETVAKLDEMRSAEGDNTRKDIERMLTTIASDVAVIRTHAKENVERQMALLRENIHTLTNGAAVDESRIVQEAGMLANRVNINEEMVRLESHLQQAGGMVKKEGVSKELEFLAQEMLRETNTIASKAQHIDIIRATLSIKSLIDEFKEQLRNIV
ncbi:MAG: YicC family protein [Spirochaetes bacterium]|nr:YicC family protein [Spirochaetota bacterium]